MAWWLKYWVHTGPELASPNTHIKAGRGSMHMLYQCRGGGVKHILGAY